MTSILLKSRLPINAREAGQHVVAWCKAIGVEIPEMCKACRVHKSTPYKWLKSRKKRGGYSVNVYLKFALHGAD